MKNVIKIFVVLLFISSDFGFANDRLLNKYLEIAAKNNPEIKAEYSRYQASMQKASQVSTLPDPEFMAGYFAKRMSGTGEIARFSLMQMFPWFGTLTAAENVANANSESIYSIYNETRTKLYFEVKTAYYNLYYVNKSIELTEQNINILQTLEQIVLIKIESGQTSSVDALRLQIEIADWENKLLLLKDNFNVQLVAFNKLLNVDSNSEVQLPNVLNSPDFNLDKNEVLNKIINGNYQIEALEHRETALKAQEKVVVNMGKPSFNVGLEYMAFGDFSNKDAIMFPRIGLSLPIYRNKYNAMRMEVEFMLQANNETIALNKNKLETSLENSFKDYNDARRRLVLYKEQIERAEQASRIIETDYLNTNTNFEEVLRMQRKILDFNLKLEQTRSDISTSIAFITYLMGEL